MVKPVRSPTFNCAEVKLNRQLFVDDGKWQAVMIEADGSLSALAKAFIESTWEVAKNCKAVNPPAQEKWRVYISNETRKLTSQRRGMFKHLRDKDFDIQAYKDLWARVQKSKKKDACVARTRKTQEIAEIVQENRYKDLWVEINRCESSGVSDKPVLDEATGQAVYNKKNKEKLWAKHFGDLEYWSDKFPIKRACYLSATNPLRSKNSG